MVNRGQVAPGGKTNIERGHWGCQIPPKLTHNLMNVPSADAGLTVFSMSGLKGAGQPWPKMWLEWSWCLTPTMPTKTRTWKRCKFGIFVIELLSVSSINYLNHERIIE